MEVFGHLLEPGGFRGRRSLNLVEYAEPGEKSLSRSCDRKFTAACFFFSFFH